MSSPRTRSIRFRIVVLLLIPLLSLVALWAYAANLTVRDALAQRNYQTLDERFAPSGQALLLAVGAERLASAKFLSSPAVPRQEVDAQRRKVDQAAARFREDARSGAAGSATTARMDQRIAEVLGELDALSGVRDAVDARRATRLETVRSYSGLVDTVHRLYDSLIAIDNAGLYQWTLSSRYGGRAMELVSRENALVSGAFVSRGRMTAGERRLFVELVGEQRQMWAKQRSLAGRGVYAQTMEGALTSPQYIAFSGLEDRIAEHPRGPVPARPAEWAAAVQPVVTSANEGLLRSSRMAGAHADDLGSAALLRVGLVGGLGLLAVVASVLLSVRFGRRLVRDLVGLRKGARQLADERLPDVVERLREGRHVDVSSEAPPLRIGRTTEVAAVAEAMSSVQWTAIDAAVGQADLRRGIGRVFLNIARRNQSLLHRQLAMLDTLERRAEPDELDDLFRLDHLTTRMRRHAESLIILSGAMPGRGWRDPVRVIDVLRGAVAEVEDYTRVSVLTTSQDAVVGAAVTDVIHLLAELVENATAFSPPNTEVQVMAEMVGTGFAVEIEDRGLGVSPATLTEINRRLAEPPEFDLADSDQLGLFVVGKLAARHGVKVSLRPSPYGGTTAIVLLPHEIVVPEGRYESQHAIAPAATSLGRERRPALVAESGPAFVFEGGTALALQRPALTGGDPPRGGDPGEPAERGGLGGPAEPSGPADPADPAGPAGPAGLAGGPAEEPEERAESEELRPGADHATHAGLPRRVRQRNIAPQLRDEPTGPQRLATEEDAEVIARSPEEARSLMSSMQRGWERGRASAEVDAGSADDGAATSSAGGAATSSANGGAATSGDGDGNGAATSSADGGAATSENEDEDV